MDDLGFILASYIVTIGGVAAYAVAVVRRARRAARDIPREDRPWA